MDHGNAIGYVQNHPDVDRLRLLGEVASGAYCHIHIRIHLFDHFTGLEYLHTSNIVHGDLRGVRKLYHFTRHSYSSCQANVLISKRGKACLSDFGFSKVLEEVRDGAHNTGVNMTDPHATVRSRNELYHRYEQFSVECPGTHRSCINRSTESIFLDMYRCLEFWDAVP
jgi:serine/threonine protein kinase